MVIMPDTLQRLYNEDQNHIAQWKGRYKLQDIKGLNRDIRRRLSLVLQERPLRTARDFYLAAHIHQHAFTISSSREALRCAQKSVALGNRNGKWLVAAATDRLLQLQGRPQRFGTQPEDMDARPMRQYRTDPRTTDEERASYGLPPLRELKKSIEKG